MTSRTPGLALCVLTLACVGLYPALQSHGAVSPPQPPAVQATPAKARVDLVFVLDTTGSMSGLIEAAKEKIWSIATSMAQAQPAPEIRVGLVAYRDRGDDYVTRTFDLTTDLDSMYAQLMDFAAGGGGDGPEAVNEALHAAVTRLAWSSDQDAYKVVFLVGDAPPHMDYSDDVKFPATLALARQKGIVINTIQCGEDRSTTQPWQQIATLGAGNFLQVGQGGSAVAITTPFDEKLASVSAKLDQTRLYYGDAARKAEKQQKLDATRKLEAGASMASKARRATFNATASGSANLLGDSELVEDVKRGRVDLGKLRKEELPAPMAAMAPAAQAAFIEQHAAERDALQKELAATAEARAKYLSDKVSATENAASSLDQQLFGTLREQASKRGLHFDAKDGPAY